MTNQFFAALFGISGRVAVLELRRGTPHGRAYSRGGVTARDTTRDDLAGDARESHGGPRANACRMVRHSWHRLALLPEFRRRRGASRRPHRTTDVDGLHRGRPVSYRSRRHCDSFDEQVSAYRQARCPKQSGSDSFRPDEGRIEAAN